jgi:hypothetical protein
MKCCAPSIILFFFLSFFSEAHSQDEWLCREASSVRQGDILIACGVGVGAYEAHARQEALRHAYYEMKQICRMSSSCNSETLDVRPLRTDCKRWKEKGYKCYRGIQASIVPMSPVAHSILDQKPLEKGVKQQARRIDELHQITEAIADEMARRFF